MATAPCRAACRDATWIAKLARQLARRARPLRWRESQGKPQGCSCERNGRGPSRLDHGARLQVLQGGERITRSQSPLRTSS
eukprot:4068154-Lingulodinium_polyedra.AAC.1